MLDYIRVACAVPAVQVADVKQNTRDICDKIAEAENAGCEELSAFRTGAEVLEMAGEDYMDPEEASFEIEEV